MSSRIILRTRVDLTNYTRATQQIIEMAQGDMSGYIIPANVHVVMTAFWQKSYQNIVDQAVLITPDGMPLVWGLRLLGLSQASRVYGPDLMLNICQEASQNSIPIYLYGGTETGLKKLVENLMKQFPRLNIAGYNSPPFRSLTPEEEIDTITHLNQSEAKIIFIGLGCPKQEIWMANHCDQIGKILIGVGAAFSFHSNEVSQAPRWLMKLGLEWLYRLVMEPKRLWKRYLVNNPTFMILFFKQLINHKIFSLKKAIKTVLTPPT